MAKAEDITTSRLLITHFQKRHLTERYVSWLNDPEVVRFSEQRHKRHTLESCRQYWQSFEGTPHYFWAIELHGNQEHIGNINAYVDPNNASADIGIVIGEKKLWHQGYGLEAFQAVCHFLLNILELRKVSAGTMVSNTAMLKIMERVQMIEETRRPQHFLWEGKQVALVQMALYNPLWKEK